MNRRRRRLAVRHIEDEVRARAATGTRGVPRTHARTRVCVRACVRARDPSGVWFHSSAPAGFDCRCGNLFCAIHRYSDKHDCPYDYRGAAAARIRKENPIVVAEKIQKL